LFGGLTEKCHDLAAVFGGLTENGHESCYAGSQKP
jgi:hypothetical protein